MRTLALIPYQLRYEQKVYWRNPGAALFTFAFPVLLFVLLGALFRDTTSQTIGGAGLIQYYTPVIAAYGVMSACFVNLAITATFRREIGLLKQVRATPLPVLSYFGGLAASAIVNATVIVALVFAVGTGAYGASWPDDWLGLIVTLVVGAATFCALGLAVSALVPNADAAPAILNLVFLALLVVSGGFFPIASSSLLNQIAKFFPLRHMIEGAFAAFTPDTHTGFPWWHVAVIAAWGAAGLAFSLRYFRWEPKAA